VFTPFARAFLETAAIARPLPAPRTVPPVPPGVEAETVPIPTCESLGITPNPRLLRGGEDAAQERLRLFVAGPAASYDRPCRPFAGRDRLALLDA
jgi:deoxyribodipyrimidine photolyase